MLLPVTSLIAGSQLMFLLQVPAKTTDPKKATSAVPAAKNKANSQSSKKNFSKGSKKNAKVDDGEQSTSSSDKSTSSSSGQVVPSLLRS